MYRSKEEVGLQRTESVLTVDQPKRSKKLERNTEVLYNRSVVVGSAALLPTAGECRRDAVSQGLASRYDSGNERRRDVSSSERRNTGLLNRPTINLPHPESAPSVPVHSNNSADFVVRYTATESCAPNLSAAIGVFQVHISVVSFYYVLVPTGPS
uniref:Uncharacterized protein n=1 Tax=Schistocephalus solidus TaxID=70667 RepID=A0A0X3PGD2_SCHSO